GLQLMLIAATHLGLLAAYNLCGVMNLSYAFTFFLDGDKFNQASARYLTEEQKLDKNNYAIPTLQGILTAMYPTLEWLGKEDLETEEWHQYSPITHIDEISNPVTFLHSSADFLVPLNQLTERYAYKEFGSDLPAELKIRLKDL